MGADKSFLPIALRVRMDRDCIGFEIGWMSSFRLPASSSSLLSVRFLPLFRAFIILESVSVSIRFVRSLALRVCYFCVTVCSFLYCFVLL